MNCDRVGTPEVQTQGMGLCRAIGRIVAALNTDRAIADIALDVVKSLQELIPCDRLSLGVFSWGRWYMLEDGSFKSEGFAFPISETDTASGWVIHNGRPLLRRDIFNERRFKRDYVRIQNGEHSDLIVPLVVDDEVVGTFNFTSRAPNRYGKEELEVAQSVADAVGVAVKQFQARLEMETIREISEAVLKPVELDEILKMILTHIQAQGYDRVRLYLYDREQDVMRGTLQVGMAPDLAFTSIVYPLKKDPYAKKRLASKRPWTYRAGTPEYETVSRLNREVGIFDSRCAAPDMEWAEIPLEIVERDGSILIGQIGLDNEVSRRPLLQERLDRLMVYASHAALAIRHAQLYHKMAEEVHLRTAELNKQNRQQGTLLCINRAVQEMKHVSDLEQIVQVCYEQLLGLGLNFQALVIHRLIDEQTRTFESYEMMPSGEFNRLVMDRVNVYRMWQGGKTVYRPDLDADAGGLTPDGLAAIYRRYGIRPRCVIDIPHAQGTLALMGAHPNVFSGSDVAFLERVAGVVSVGVTRVADLEQVEVSQAALERSRRFMQRVADTAPMILYVYDVPERRNVYVNDQTAAILGYTPNVFQKIGFRTGDLNHPDDREALAAHLQRLAEVRDGEVLEVEYRMRHANGEWRWLRSRDMVFTRDADGSVRQHLGTVWDITDQKRANEQLLNYQDQLRSLTSELTLAEERERRRIARDLHDGIGQTLLVSRMKLRGLKTSTPPSVLARSMREARDFIDQAIQSIRSLTFELSLPILYELGFGAAMEWLAEQIQKQHDIRIDLEDDGQPESMDEEVAVLLFRAVRELLINVVKHARARNVKVSMKKDGGSIRIEVEDDGVGFEASKVDFGRMDTTGGFGFFSIRERLDFLGGKVQVTSTPGRGTRVVLVAPLKSDGDRESRAGSRGGNASFSAPPFPGEGSGI